MWGLIYVAIVIPPFVWVVVTAARWAWRDRGEPTVRRTTIF